MKNIQNKIILSLFGFAIFIMSVSSAYAQRAEFGLRFMPTFTKFDIKTSAGGTIQGEAKLGFGFGALLGFNFNRYVGAQGELIYSTNSQKYKEDGYERQIKLKYLNIPLLLSLNTGKTKIINLNLVAGPQIGVSVGSRLLGNNSSDSTNAILSVRKGDLGFAYGVGLDFGINEARTARLGLGYRGVYGLFDISDNSRTITTDSYYLLDRTHIKTNAIYIGLSILF